jgi:hypothetical protein
LSDVPEESRAEFEKRSANQEVPSCVHAAEPRSIVMSKSSFASAALLALALSACAHQSAQVAPTSFSYLGGRAAQPSGFIPGTNSASFAQAPTETRTGMRYLGGQAGEPQAWLDGDAWQAKNSEAASCQQAGRAAQPFSGPTVYAVRQSPEHGAVACRTDSSRL